MIFSPTHILKKLLFSFCTPSYVVDPVTVALAMQAVGKISQILGKDTDYPTAFGTISFKNGVASVVSNNAHAYDKGSLADQMVDPETYQKVDFSSVSKTPVKGSCLVLQDKTKVLIHQSKVLQR
jgi:hypothetical protein